MNNNEEFFVDTKARADDLVKVSQTLKTLAAKPVDQEWLDQLLNNEDTLELASCVADELSNDCSVNCIDTVPIANTIETLLERALELIKPMRAVDDDEELSEVIKENLSEGFKCGIKMDIEAIADELAKQAQKLTLVEQI